MWSLRFAPFLLVATAVAKYDQYILAPSSRTIHPVSVFEGGNGTVDNAETLTSPPGNAVFHDTASVVYDFSKNIGGVVTVVVNSASSSDQYIGVNFAESSQWVSEKWSDATADAGNDETLWFKVDAAGGNYTAERRHVRGGFRYLTLVSNTTGTIDVSEVKIHYTAMPHWEDDQLRNYSGYFHSNDELVNRIWYAGAYTAQICTIDPHWGNSLVHLGELESNMTVDSSVTWWSNTTIANTSSVLADGAKRDRLVWPGDMVSSWPTILVSTNDKVTVTGSLDSLYERQNASNGVLPYAGVPFPFQYSATYHLHNLIGAAEIYVYDGDLEWISGKWDQWKFGMNYSLSTVDATGLMNVSSSADWLRFGMGGHNIEANSILYHTLQYGITLAQALNDTSVIPRYQNYSTNIKSAINELLWDDGAGLYKDNQTTTLHPQDGNVWALLANVTDSDEKAQTISRNLEARWGEYGAPAPEAGATVSPFVGGFELMAHAAADNATRILGLTRLQWGFMLDDPRMTNSTFIEGYSTDGSLHYAPYSNDPRVSYAHGWSTGPTSALTFYIAGIQIVAAGGKQWEISPKLGDLTEVAAGYMAGVGFFSASTTKSDGGLSVDFQAPSGTIGTVNVEVLQCANGGHLNMTETTGACKDIDKSTKANSTAVRINGVPGGQWQLRFGCA